MSFEAKLQTMNYKIEPVSLEFGKYVQGMKAGKLTFTSGQVSSRDGKEYGDYSDWGYPVAGSQCYTRTEGKERGTRSSGKFGKRILVESEVAVLLLERGN